MDNSYFESAAKALHKTQNRVEVHKILVAIRKELDGKQVGDRIKFLVTSDSVKYLILCLRQENTAIIDLTLSILGNCCIDYAFAKDLIKYNFLHSLEALLERCQKDSIHGRAFRIIANICDHTCSHMLMIKQPKLVTMIVACLSKAAKDDAENSVKISEASIVSGLRALRKLVKLSTLPLLIEKYNVLQAVGGLLVKYSEIWKKDKNCKHVIDEILRVLLLYSSFSHSGTIAGLKLSERGNSLNSLCDILHVSLTRIVKIVINLSNVAALKSDLPVNDICRTLMNDITAADCSISEQANYLTALNELLSVPSYREFMSSTSVVLELIALLRRFDENSMKCTTLVLYILLKSNNKDLATSSIIVGVLIDKLQWFGKPSTEILRPRNYRGGDFDGLLDKRKRFKSFHNGDLMSPLIRDRYREDRCSSPSEMSDISSNGPYSPSCSSIREDICDSDNYSPVCSDAEEPDIASVHSEPQSNYSSDDDITVLSDVQDKLFTVIMSLLTRYSKLKPPTPNLADPRLLILLVNYWIDGTFEFSSTKPVIFSIIRNGDFLIPILQTDFVYLVYSRIMKTKDYKAANCKLSDIVAVLTGLAESEMGKGDIAHTLLRGADLRIRVAASIPFVVRNKSLMSKLMINCGGLKLLLGAINTESLRKQVLKGLHVLANEHLKIKNPSSGKWLADVQPIEPGEYQPPEHCQNVVLFKFEGAEEVVSADREFLTSKGCYFASLLSGNFKESNENEILLKKVRCESFKCLLIFLRDFGTKNVVCLDLDIMLELLELTDRYLLPELHVYLTDCVENMHMTELSVPVIYKWSIDSKTNILRVECIAFALVNKMQDDRRKEMFQALMQPEYNDLVVDDIGTLLLRFFKK